MHSSLPEAYKIGWVPFIHTDIYLDSRPLIPRTETEYWVNEAIQEIKKSGVVAPRILDLCAGSGCIGVAVLKEIPEALVDFAEIDPTHHETIRKNITENKFPKYFQLRKYIDSNIFLTIEFDKAIILIEKPKYIKKNSWERGYQ